jgi:hypothetical protein
MAKIKLQPEASSSNVFTIATPAGSTDYTITLPAATGTLLNSDGSAASLTSIPAANITGTLPAISGANLTGLAGNTPSFHAYLNATQGIADNSAVKLTFMAETWDTDSAFDNSTNYRFTVPAGEGGKYFIYSQIYTSTVSANRIDVTEFMIYKNGARIRREYTDTNEAGFNRFTHKITSVEDLSATDYIEIYFKGNTEPTSSSYIYEDDSYFTMFKLL